MICRIMSIEEFILRWYDTHVFGQVNVSEVKDIFKHKIPWKTMATRVVNADVMRMTQTVSEIQKTQEILVREN